MGHIRRAEQGDAEGIARVQADAWGAAYPGLLPQSALDHFSYEFRQKRWRSILAEADNPATTLVFQGSQGIEGFISVGPDRFEVGPGRGEIWALYVAPERWRSGVGRALMAAGDELLRGLGPGPHSLWVLEGNGRAQAFYESFGYRLTGEKREDGYKDGVGWWDLRMVLSEHQAPRP